MTNSLDHLIANLKQEIEQEHQRLRGTVLRTKAIEQRETGRLRRLEQRLEVLQALKAR